MPSTGSSVHLIQPRKEYTMFYIFMYKNIYFYITINLWGFLSSYFFHVFIVVRKDNMKPLKFLSSWYSIANYKHDVYRSLYYFNICVIYKISFTVFWQMKAKITIIYCNLYSLYTTKYMKIRAQKSVKVSKRNHTAQIIFCWSTNILKFLNIHLNELKF